MCLIARTPAIAPTQSQDALFKDALFNPYLLTKSVEAAQTSVPGSATVLATSKLDDPVTLLGASRRTPTAVTINAKPRSSKF